MGTKLIFDVFLINNYICDMLDLMNITHRNCIKPEIEKEEGGVNLVFYVPKEYFTPILYTGSVIEIKDVRVE